MKIFRRHAIHGSIIFLWDPDVNDRPLQEDMLLQSIEGEIEWQYVRSGGPGGQNVNKVASKAIMHWNAIATDAISDDIRLRIIAIESSRLTTDGFIVISSQKYRDQERNRTDCLEKLRSIIRRALHVPKKRKATRPTAASRRVRVDTKRRRGAVKQNRRRSFHDDE